MSLSLNPKYTITDVESNDTYFNYTVNNPDSTRIIYRDVYIDLNKWLVPQLKNFCKYLNIIGYSKLKKADLINVISKTDFYNNIKSKNLKTEFESKLKLDENKVDFSKYKKRIFNNITNSLKIAFKEHKVNSQTIKSILDENKSEIEERVNRIIRNEDYDIINNDLALEYIFNDKFIKDKKIFNDYDELLKYIKSK